MKGPVVSQLVAVVLLVALTAVLSSPVVAQPRAPFSEACSAWRSSRAFVGESVKHCLSASHQRHCERAAREYFARCGFEGSYSRINDEFTRKILVMMVLNRNPSMTVASKRDS